MAEIKEERLTQLGGKAEIPASPGDARLESFENPNPDVDYVVRFTCPEFTSLCPVTGQPDFAHFVIDYVPNKACIESKSLKLFMASWRNTGAFHEAATLTIATRLTVAMAPKWLRISGFWYPRGGIPIDVYYQSAKPPEGVHVPDPGVPPYGGRG